MSRRRCLTCWRKPGDTPFCGPCGKSFVRATSGRVVLLTDAVKWAVRRAFAMQERWLERQEVRARPPEYDGDACDACSAEADIFFSDGRRFCRQHAPARETAPGEEDK